MNFYTLFENNFVAAFPELFISFAICVLLVYGVIYSTSSDYGLPLIAENMGWLAIQTFALALLLIGNQSFGTMSLFNNTMIHDLGVSGIQILLLLGSIFCLLISFDYLKEEKLHAFEYIMLMMLSVLGMMLITASYDLISMYLAIELQSLCLYVLAAFKKNSAFSTEAGLKYFILGALSSGLLLFGSSLIYGFSGTTNFEDLARLCTGTHDSMHLISTGVLVGLSFIGAGLFFKIAAVPFHMWSPDVYEGAPTSVSAFFAIVPKVAILGVLIRIFMVSFYDFIPIWQQMIILCSFGSMVVGAFGALQQKKIKRLLAYSSIGHVGYLLVGLSTGTLEGVHGMLIYIAIYMVMSLNMWTCLLSLSFQGQYGRVQYLTDFISLSKINPLLAITITLGMFSMAGVPPLAGFCAKMYIFFAAMEASMYALAIAGVLTSVVGSYYYIRLIKVMFFEKSSTWRLYKPIDREKSLVLAITTIFIMFFFAYPTPLLVSLQHMAITLTC